MNTKNSESREVQIAHPSLGSEEVEALKQTIESGWITQGSQVAEFEEVFAKRHEAKYAVATSSCTTGLHLILKALDIGPDDEVIVPAFTWIATANVVVQCGATPVFVDIDPLTYNIDPTKISDHITKKTRAVIVVHLFGLCADIENIKAVLPDGVHLVEDAACAVGAMVSDQNAGTFGIAASFSFHPRKIITTGEGGMITTDDEHLYELLKMLRNHGATISEERRHLSPKPYDLPDFDNCGFNYRMTDLQGAVGLVQMKKLDEMLSERQVRAANYIETLSELTWLRMPMVPEYFYHSWQSFVTYLESEKSSISRNEVMSGLHERGVATRPGTHALHILGYYKKAFDFSPSDFPNSLASAQNSMAIPLHNQMSSEDYEYVIQAINSLDV